MHMIVAPKMTAARRPRPSDMYGENGYAARHPMFCTKGGGRFRTFRAGSGPLKKDRTNLDGTEQTQLRRILARVQEHCQRGTPTFPPLG